MHGGERTPYRSHFSPSVWCQGSEGLIHRIRKFLAAVEGDTGSGSSSKSSEVRQAGSSRDVQKKCLLTLENMVLLPLQPLQQGFGQGSLLSSHVES